MSTAPTLRILTTFPPQLLARVEREVPGVSVTGVPTEGAVPDDVRGDVLLIPPWDPGNLEALLGRGVVVELEALW